MRGAEGRPGPGADPAPVRRAPLTDLLLRAQGWTDHRDATLLRQDPLLRLAVSERRGEAPVRGAEGRRTPDGLASQPTLTQLLRRLCQPWRIRTHPSPSRHHQPAVASKRSWICSALPILLRLTSRQPPKCFLQPWRSCLSSPVSQGHWSTRWCQRLRRLRD